MTFGRPVCRSELVREAVCQQKRIAGLANKLSPTEEAVCQENRIVRLANKLSPTEERARHLLQTKTRLFYVHRIKPDHDFEIPRLSGVFQ